MTPEQLEDTEAAILQGLDPAGPCTCGSDPDFSCTLCGQSMRGQEELAKLMKYIASLEARVARLKPSEQVAEDVDLLRNVIPRGVFRDEPDGTTLVSGAAYDEALARLATQAHAAQVLAEALINLRCISVSQGVSEQHGVIVNADDALRLVGRLP